MREKLGVRTHILLVVAMAVIIAVVTGLSLLLIRHHLRDQVTADLSWISITQSSRSRIFRRSA